jgi:outer membrane receptor for ferrienterochelin and colicins
MLQLKMIFIFICSAAAADEAATAGEDAIEELVVTGTRAPRDRSRDPLATKVIDRSDIEASGAEDVADLLQQVPGVDVRPSFLGSELRLQGMDPDQVLVLIDGQRLNGRVGGAIDLSRIPVDSIERIEIVEGTASALYGADAMGGVVHIITRSGDDEVRANLHARGGTVGTGDGSAGLSFGDDRAAIRLDAGLHRNAAFDRRPEDPATTGDANTQGQFSSRGDLKLGADGHVALLGSYSRRDQQGVDGDGTTAVFDRRNLVEEVRATVDPRWVTDPNGQLTGHLGISYYRDQYVLDQRGSTYLDDQQETRDLLLQGGLQVQRLVGSHDLLLGVEGIGESLQAERIDQGGAQRQRIGAYVQDEWRVARPLVLLPSGRVDTDSTFGSWPTGRIAARLDPSDALRLRASVGNGLRAPSFREQNLRFANASVGYVIEGNPDLLPERSLQASASLDAQVAEVGNLSVSGFWNEVTDLIAVGTLAASPGRLRLGYVNISDATTRGGEVATSAKLGPGELSLSYTFTDAIDRSLARPLEGRARHRATANLGLRTRRGTRFTGRTAVVGPRIFYSDALDPQATVSTAPAYVELDLRAQQAMSDRFAVFAGVDNLLDAGDADRLPLTPRLLYAGVDGRFGAEPTLRGTP